MTYNVFSGTLNPTHSHTHSLGWSFQFFFFLGGGAGHPRPPSGCALDCVINVLVSINDVTRRLSLNGTECLQQLCAVALRTDRLTVDAFFCWRI